MLRQALACCLVLALLLLPAPAWAKSLKASVPFSKGATDPTISLVLKRSTKSVEIELPDAGLVPEIEGPFRTDGKKPAGSPSVSVAADGGVLSSKNGKRTLVIKPARASAYPANYRVTLRGTATRKGKASIRAQYIDNWAEDGLCDGVGMCLLAGAGIVIAVPLVVIALPIWGIYAVKEARSERKEREEKALLPTRFTVKTPTQMAEGAPTSLRLDADRGILLPPQRITVAESCRAARNVPLSEPVVTLFDAKAVSQEKWHTLSFIYTPQQAGLCELEIRVEGQTTAQKSYALTAMTKPLTIRARSSSQGATP